MAYHLLTGVTGLVGRYLLRELLAADVPLAVLVRPSRLQSAEDRLEAVLAPWEAEQGRLLPRPVILQGDVNGPMLGLSTPHVQWVQSHVDTVVHSAAAMVFRPDSRGEPHRTNVDGMRNMLDFCQQSGVRFFHHVSTAYICGLRTGRVREDELDVGQTLGNVYEESKLLAEKMLREFSGFEQTTIFRPASVIGDSRTGFTSNFHGFYLPLQLAHSFAGTIPPAEMNERFFQRLGLSGNEGKNFVPVDWLTSAMAHVITHPELHGETYHLAAPQPVSVKLFQSIVQEAMLRYGKKPHSTPLRSDELDVYEKLFHDRLLIYQSHWRDDPIFDLTNSQRALPQLPCPTMDFDLLMRVARWPVENNFPTPKYVKVDKPFDQHRFFDRWLTNSERSMQVSTGDHDGASRVTLQINGCGGGKWQLLLQGGRLVGVEMGADGKSQTHCYLNSETFARLADGSLTVEEAVRRGRVLVEGNTSSPSQLAAILAQLMDSAAESRSLARFASPT